MAAQNEVLQKQQNDLAAIKEAWAEKQEQNRRREEMEKLMQIKKEQQEKELLALNKAAEWVQAHWRGFMARKEYGGKKKKKGKGKKGKKWGLFAH